MTILDAYFRLIQLVERQETRACKIGFLAENAVQLDGMPDGFVNLQAQLAAAEDAAFRFFPDIVTRNGVPPLLPR